MTKTWSATVVALLAAATLGAAPHAAEAAAAASVQTVTVDGKDNGRTFDGVGALSAGGSSRLLFDYPEPERSQILDYLFKPGYGAALDILKVEIGADTDSTSGAEPGHLRQPGEPNCGRGYEWWLMKEARQRNPDIALYGLMWGAPGWFDGGMWSQDHVDYIVAWLRCARENGLRIDYVGGGNQWYVPRPQPEFFVALDHALTKSFPDVQIVATDEHTPPRYWAPATEMVNDPEYAAAVDVVGEHDICGWQTTYRHCHVSEDALALGKPLWVSEQSTEDYAAWGSALARAMNRNYIDARVTGNINWALTASFYSTFPAAGTGLLLADRPWSGYYDLGQAIWVDAHTTQFTERGWRYLNGASGYLDGGSSHVALRSPDTGDYTVVVETVDAEAPETVRFEVTGGVADGPVHLWSTDLATAGQDDDFVHERAVRPDDGSYTVTFQPGHLYTLSTTTGQGKGTATPRSGPAETMSLPYHENFENEGPDRLAEYFSDVMGAFEAAHCGGGRGGTCYRQVLTDAPIDWHDHVQPPTTIVGDPRWWGNYEISVDAMLEEPGYVELLGRVESQRHRVAGYHLRVADGGGWRLYTEDVSGETTTLAEGTTEIGTGTWHRLALRFRGRTVTASLDGEELAEVRDASHTRGQVGLRVSPWDRAQFDDLRVVPTGPRPHFARVSAVTASSDHPAPHKGKAFGASKAVDLRPESMWRSQWDPYAPLPQTLTLDLGRPRPVHALVYRPRLDSTSGGLVTGYRVSVSRDGETFERVANGTWARTIATKVASWDELRIARYVRLEVTSSAGCYVSAAEVRAATTPIRDMAAPGEPPSDGNVPTYEHLVPQEDIVASASSAHAGYEAGGAVDGDCTTLWHSEWSPYQPPPQALTLDLGDTYDTRALVYLPRQDGARNGTATGYTVEVSRNGETFTKVASGRWDADARTKAVEWPATPARYVRLTVTDGVGGYASAAEVNVAYSP